MLKLLTALCVVINTVSPAYIKFDTTINHEDYCYSLDKNPYVYLGTKTGYEFVYGRNDTQHLIPNCKPVQFWSINRHGTRLPGKAGIKELRKLLKIKKEILNNYENTIGELCEEDIQSFQKWQWNNSVSENISTTLTEQGWDDMRNLARRYKIKFPELLDIPYSEEKFLFRYTQTERTKSSFKAYAQGLFGNADGIDGISFVNDTLLQTYKHCKFWQETVDENPDTFIEYGKLLNSDVYKNMVSEVSERLGFKFALNSSVIENMFDMCRYEQAWFVQNHSTWCAAFTKKHLQILEYAEDLQYYYGTGHGTQLNSKVGCMPLQDMIKRFSNVINGDSSEPKAVLYFTHSSAIQLLLVSMGINKDPVPLTAANMDLQKNRLWRTSLLGPFAANLDAIIYKCYGNDENKVIFYLNEKKVQYPGCMDGVCSWNFLKEKLGHIAENCSLDFCKNNL